MPTRPKPQKPFTIIRHHLVALFVVALLGIGIVLGATVFSQPITNQLNTWDLLPQPERLTELYFAHPNTLPATYVPGQEQTVSFTIHNLEYRPMVYRYEIVEQNQDGSSTTMLASGQVSLDQDQTETLSLPVALTDMGKQAGVFVNVTSVHESIHYWVEKA